MLLLAAVLSVGCPASPGNDGCGAASPGARLLYPDADGDGWGVPGELVAGCAGRKGYSVQWTDCDDADPDVFPEAADDVCDGVDQNCDGQFDEGAPTAQAWYPDEDGDGHGSSAGARLGCVAPDGLVASGDDCDDADAGRLPGGADDCVGWSGVAEVTWGSVGTGELADTANAWLVGGRDLNGDGEPDLLLNLDEHNWGGPERFPSFVLAAAGAGHTDLRSATVGWIDSGAEGASGPRTAWAPDWDGDGTPDILAQTPDLDNCVIPVPAGRVSLGDAETCFAGAATFAATTPTGSTHDWLAFSPEAGDTISVVSRGTSGGALAEVGHTLTARGASGFGDAVAEAGDIDGDGLDDLYATTSANAAHPDFGGVYLLLGPFQGDADVSGGATEIAGTASFPADYAALRDAGDLDGDGRDDLLAVDEGGAARTFADPTTARTLDDATAMLLTTRCEGSGLGEALLTHDINHDGAPDLVVSASSCSLQRDDDGAVFAFAGPLAGTRELQSAEAVIHGEQAWDGFGTSIAPIGDWNADGLPDLAVSYWPELDDGTGDGVIFVTVDL